MGILNRIGKAKKTNKTSLYEQQLSLKSAVDSMVNFKHERSQRGKEIYLEYRERIPKMISNLRKLGVKEETHPIFRDALSTFNYFTRY